MAGLRTEGFGLSTLSRAPDIPENLGKLDVEGIYNAAKAGLLQSEAMASSYHRQLANAEEAQTQIAQSRATRDVLPSSVLASKATNEGTVRDAPVRSSLLSSEAARAAAGVAPAQQAATLALATTDQQKAFRDQAKVDMPSFQQDYQDAISLADHRARADALSSLPVKYPWLHVLYKDTTAADIDKVAESARTAAEKEEDRQTKLDIADKLVSGKKYSGTAGLVQLMQESGYDQNVIEQVLNKVSATEARNPNAPTAGSFPGLQAARDELVAKRSQTTDLAEIGQLDNAISEITNHIKVLNTPKAEKKGLSALDSFLGTSAETAAPTTAAGVKGPSRVATWDDAKALPAGSHYIGPDGQEYIRGGGK